MYRESRKSKITDPQITTNSNDEFIVESIARKVEQEFRSFHDY